MPDITFEGRLVAEDLYLMWLCTASKGLIGINKRQIVYYEEEKT